MPVTEDCEKGAVDPFLKEQKEGWLLLLNAQAVSTIRLRDFVAGPDQDPEHCSRVSACFAHSAPNREARKEADPNRFQPRRYGALSLRAGPWEQSSMPFPRGFGKTGIVKINGRVL